jgi:hypothetical protein
VAHLADDDLGQKPETLTLIAFYPLHGGRKHGDADDLLASVHVQRAQGKGVRCVPLEFFYFHLRKKKRETIDV